jgi:hypothetical protein
VKRSEKSAFLPVVTAPMAATTLKKQMNPSRSVVLAGARAATHAVCWLESQSGRGQSQPAGRAKAINLK